MAHAGTFPVVGLGFADGRGAGLDLRGEDVVGEDVVGEDVVGEDVVGEDVVGEDVVSEDVVGLGRGTDVEDVPPAGVAGAACPRTGRASVISPMPVAPATPTPAAALKPKRNIWRRLGL